MTFESLIEFEQKSEKLFNFKATNGMLFWPIVRFQIHQTALNSLYSFSNPHADSDRLSLFDSLKWFFLTLWRNVFIAPRGKLIVFGSNVVNMLEKGRYRNRLYDSLLEWFPRAVVLSEDSYRRTYRRPRMRTVWYSDIIKIVVGVLSRTHFLKSEDRRAVNEFINYLQSSYPYKLDKDVYMKARLSLFKAIKKWRLYRILYAALINLKNYKSILIEDSSYGSDNAIIIKHLNDMKIGTIEMQHGLVAKNHPAYNYPASICHKSNCYYEYLPKYFLSFGDYWSGSIRTPSEKRIVGFPYLNEKASTQDNTSPNTVLVVSDGTNPSQVIEICTALNKTCEYSITLKLHPGEVPLKDERYGRIPNTIAIKTYESVYELLKTHEYIVGFASTVLVEALAFKKVPYVLRTEYSIELFSKIDFNYFDNTENLLALIHEHRANEKANMDQYWAVDSRAKFASFLKEIGVIP